MTYIGRACVSLSDMNKSEHFLKAHYCKLFNSINVYLNSLLSYDGIMPRKGFIGSLNRIRISSEKELLGIPHL